MQAQRDFWFRPKRCGYGAEPANWWGWLATGLYLMVVLTATWRFMIEPAVEGLSPSATELAVWFVTLIAATLVFVWLCWIKTDGTWHWRWGRSD